MPEAEVSLRLAFYLLHNGLSKSAVHIAIDGAQIKTGEHLHFDINTFLQQSGCTACGQNDSWRGRFKHNLAGFEFVIHSRPGRGDVVAELTNGRTLRVESKKGPLTTSRSSIEFPLLHEALGQILTVAEVQDTDLLAVAVPHSPKFVQLAERWRQAPLVRRIGILILTVDRANQVHGLSISDALSPYP